MAEERDIEKQLRAAAEERRRESGGPFELHPATRRLLQDEARRVYGQPAPGEAEKSSWLARFWPQLAAGACGLALLAVVGAMLLPGLASAKRKSQHATKTAQMRNLQPAQVPQARFGGAVATAPPPPAALPASVPGSSAVAGAQTPPAGGSPPSLNIVSGMSAQQSFYFRNARTPVAVSDYVDRVKGADVAKLESRKALDRQRQLGVEKLPLASFQVEQTGDQIRIIDSDGSVYRGNLLATNAVTAVTASGGAGWAGLPMPPRETPTQAQQASRLPIDKRRDQHLNLSRQTTWNFWFRASGTNLSLQQRIAIHGEFVPATNLAAVTGTIQGGSGGANAQMMINGQQWLSNGRIVGKAVLGNGLEIPLNATSASQ